jgi:prepilin-type N-terminal cleavage/methylation domain-containing protein
VRPGPPTVAGFTLLELLVVMAILAILALLGLPALQNMIQRSKTEVVTRNSAAIFMNARMTALRRGVPVGVQMDFTRGCLFSYLEMGEPPDGFTPGTDVELRRLDLLGGVDFWGPPDAGPRGENAVDGFAATALDEGYVIFDVNGSVNLAGAFRYGDLRGNFLEIRVAPPATARLVVRKYESRGGVPDWYEQGEDGISWTWY